MGCAALPRSNYIIEVENFKHRKRTISLIEAANPKWADSIFSVNYFIRFDDAAAAVAREFKNLIIFGALQNDNSSMECNNIIM